jgi:hypothetical protein
LRQPETIAARYQQNQIAARYQQNQLLNDS